jgi:hypothetical protein
MRRKAPLGSQFEALEDRTLPATWGVPWPDPGQLTLSFVPDGTQTPLGPSVLDQVLIQAAGSVQAGEQIILSAFQAWASQSNINIGVVADGGEPLGTAGALQGDSRFGDIRIAAAPLSPDSVANSLPFSFTGATLSGDVILNSNLTFGVGNSSSFYDLYSVAIHEAGHVFGFGDITTPGSTSVMNQDYSYRTGLTPGDVSALQALYGTPQADTYSANNSIFNAASVPQSSEGDLQASGDLTTPGSVEFFKFNTPLLTTTLSGIEVRLQTEGVSLLTAKVTVYNAVGSVIDSTETTDPLNNNLTLKFEPNLISGLLGGTYYIEVQGAPDAGVFGVGSYKLAVDFLSLDSILAPIVTGLVATPSNGLISTLATALGVQSNPSGASGGFDAVHLGVLTNAGQVDTYRIGTNKYSAGTSVTLNVMVWGLDPTPLDPEVEVFDANGSPVAFQVLANEPGLFSVQIPDAVAGTYYVQVFAKPGATQTTGSYFFAADFDQLALTEYANVADGTLNPGTTTTAGTLDLTQAGVYQFALGASSAQTGGTVTMSVYNASGNLVFTLTAEAGQPPVTATEYLLAGTYTVIYSAAQGTGAPVNFGLFMDELSDLSGPSTTSTASPTSSTSTSSTSSSSSTSTSSSTSSSTSTTAPTASTTTSAPPATSSTSYTYSGSSSSSSSGYYYTY